MSKAEKLVLVVDNNADNRTLLADVVKGLCGAEVIEANNAADALDKLQKTSRTIDGVVTDLAMEDMDGFVFLATLQEMMPDIPIAMLVTTSYLSGGGTLPSDVTVPEFLDKSQIMGKVEVFKIADKLNQLLNQALTGKK